MNYLELCNTVKEYAGIAGPRILDVKRPGPHINKLICDWVREAWINIQTDARLRPNFGYVKTQRLVCIPHIMAHEYTYRDFKLPDGVEFDFETFGYKTDLVRQKRPIPLPKGNLGEVEVRVPVDEHPKVVVPTSPNSFFLVPTNKNVLHLFCNYWEPPQVLEDNTDRPRGLLDHHHAVIVYRALVSYAIYDAAQEILQFAEMKYQEYMREIYSKYTVNSYPKQIRFNRFC